MVKQKVTLTFEKNHQELRGLSKNCFGKEIEIEIPSDINGEVFLTSARVHSNNQGSSNMLTEDVTATIWSYQDEQRIVGKLLTYVDATFTDKEQRDAHKNIVKDLVYGYCQELRTRAHQTIDSASIK